MIAPGIVEVIVEGEEGRMAGVLEPEIEARTEEMDAEPGAEASAAAMGWSLAEMRVLFPAMVCRAVCWSRCWLDCARVCGGVFVKECEGKERMKGSVSNAYSLRQGLEVTEIYPYLADGGLLENGGLWDSIPAGERKLVKSQTPTTIGVTAMP